MFVNIDSEIWINFAHVAKIKMEREGTDGVRFTFYADKENTLGSVRTTNDTPAYKRLTEAIANFGK